jgi:kynurenine formamidase
MKVSFKTDSFDIDLASPLDISIPLRFNGPQPNAYGVQQAASTPCQAGDLVGDTRQGGSCNFEQYTFIPHCNGTHTECVGHITNDRISVRDCLQDVLIPAVLISVTPVRAGDSNERYAVAPGAGDFVITRRSLESAIGSVPPALAGGTERSGLSSSDEHSADTSGAAIPPANAGNTDRALIIRTLPNDESKLTRQYTDATSPYFTSEAMEFIVSRGYKHLLVDLPSIDRLYDEGKLSNHRIFWNVEQGSFQVNDEARINSTITELIYVPGEVADGDYLLNLQIAPFEADSSPSRPMLIKTS